MLNIKSYMLEFKFCFKFKPCVLLGGQGINWSKSGGEGGPRGQCPGSEPSRRPGGGGARPGLCP